MIGLRRQVCDGFEGAFGGEDELVIALEADACDKVRRRAVFDMTDQFEERFFALSTNDIVDVGCLECLGRKQRRMPSAENDRKVRVPRFDGFGNLDRLSNHRSGHQRDAEA